MQVTHTPLRDALILEPKIYPDGRGFFVESWNRKTFQEAIGRDVRFVQDNHSRSGQGVLRGLHYQLGKVQAKLVRVVRGVIRDVIVDLRQSSTTFGQWFAVELSATNGKQLWIPEGFAHGFFVLSDEVDLLYKTTEYYCPECERTIVWDDPDLAIDWAIASEIEPNFSDKDRCGEKFKDSEYFP